MRGRPGCPTEQEKNSVGATFGPPFSASTRKGWVQGRPLIRPSVRTGAPSPQGEGFGRWEVLFPSEKPPFPARPAGGRAVTGVRYRAAGQAEKREDPLQGPKNQSRESRGEKLSPLALFPPFLGRNGGPRRVGALRGAAPRGRSKPRPPEGYAVPHRSPARDRAGTHVAGLDLRWSQRNHLPTAPPPKAGPRDRACRAPSLRQWGLPHSSTTSPVENWVTCAPNSSRSRANPRSPVQWPVRIWATPVSRRRRARARTSWSGVS